MTKLQMIGTIQSLIQEMTPLLTLMKVDLSKLEFINTDVERLLAHDIHQGYDYILDYYDNYYKPLVRIRKSQSEEQWAKYESWGDFEDFREVIILQKRTLECQKRINRVKRPMMFKKTRVASYIRKLDRNAKRQASAKQVTTKKRSKYTGQAEPKY